MRSRFWPFVCLPFLALASASPALAGQSELEKIFARHPASPASNICMIRHYDTAHLASHPDQNVTDMLVYIGKRQGEQDGFVYYDINAQLRFRDSKKDWTFSGGCGRKAGEASSIGCGIDCDGGGYDVSIKDDKSIALKITSAIRLSEPESDEPVNTAGFKSGDNDFILKQTALRDCLPVIYDDDLKARISSGAVTQ
ncbi:MAG: hypothetical protein JWM58_1676 [Rhizobium sp.]|nr:hypothetical protein [Rhizobium sp.]